MNIPVFRHNVDLDDWEVASVYDSDDCGSLGGSAYGASVHSGCSLLDPALYPEGYTYGDGRPRFVNGYPVPQQQRQKYSPVAPARPRWEAPHPSGSPSAFVVPPPGVIFPPKDWAHPPQEMYWPTTTNQMASSSDLHAGVGLMPSPPLPPLLLSPSSPPPAASALIKRPSPVTTIVHGQSHGTHTVPGPCTGTTISAHASPMMPPPPRYHEVALAVPPRLADAGCQAHPGMATSPPRRSGHEVVPSYAAGPGHGTISRGPRISGEFSAAEGRYGGPGASGHPSYGPGDRSDGHPPTVPSKYEHEELEQDGGHAWAGRPYRRERRPSIWQRFVRRFSPSHVSVGQT